MTMIWEYIRACCGGCLFSFFDTITGTEKRKDRGLCGTSVPAVVLLLLLLLLLLLPRRVRLVESLSLSL